MVIRENLFSEPTRVAYDSVATCIGINGNMSTIDHPVVDFVWHACGNNELRSLLYTIRGTLQEGHLIAGRPLR